MKQFGTVTGFQDYRKSLTGSLGFVPTMGALHEGHRSLVQRSVEECDHTIVSIYVNPTQFNSANDLENYPDRRQEDIDILLTADVSAVFLPGYDDLYPDGFAYEVNEKSLSRELCGANRPGHFTGVLTVVMKLLNIVRPDRAYFGEKDYQQLSLVRGMTKAFFLDVDVIGCPTVRESDGLAMSSRNLNLSEEDRARAGQFYEILKNTGADTMAGKELRDAGFSVDYVTTIDKRRYGAVVVGPEGTQVRLIDNVALE